MAKVKTVFVCSQCSHEEPKWSGRCPDCGEWNTFSEITPLSAAKSGAGRETKKGTSSVPLSSISSDQGERISSNIDEVDRVLGGGLVRGSSILIGGEPGIGKSTLMLQTAAAADMKGRVLYVTGEESAAQLKQRADRVGIKDSAVEVLCETDLESVLRSLQSLKPTLVVIDSIQTLVSPELGTVPGTPNQIKYCCHEIITFCRERGCPVFLVAHVTKEGAIAGPKLIEHMVDTVLYFDQSSSELRILRASKNRFGSVDEIGLFTMGARGLEQVRNPASLFLVHRDGELPPGIIVAPVYEGSRVLLVEIQSLVVPAKGAVSRIFSDRIDSGRVSRTAAVLEKHLSLRFADQDIYINVAGGIKIHEVGIELPLGLALYSARTSVPVPNKTAAAGELTLAGEIRPISHMPRRVRTAREMGFTNVIGSPPQEKSDNPDWRAVSSISDSISAVFGKRSGK
ncbi:MAG: DNA repair protein RadA [Spirochaetales bacterium]|jgi:DNA repair protein RadA/Sms|nr:DNA repair protein RadA [Spirochaetales bacterium]